MAWDENSHKKQNSHKQQRLFQENLRNRKPDLHFLKVIPQNLYGNAEITLLL